MSDSAVPPGAGTLNGWKDIASFLGKSVRAVQRWERDFGLPVHRIKTPTGQVVYAFIAEIEAWRAAMEERPDHVPSHDEPAPSRPAISRLAWALLIGAAILFAIPAGSVLVKQVVARPLVVTRYEISGTSLVALTAERHVVWSHDFGWQPQPLKYADNGGVRTVDADLDGDGKPELLAVVHSPVRNGEPWRETFFCFTDGRLRWSYTPTLSLTYEGHVFEGPWRQYHMTTTTGPGRQRVWVSFGHHTWWPSFVVELDAAGTATPRYFQSGAIYEVAVWSAGSGEFLVASGVDNEYARASLAVLDVNAPASTSPQHGSTGFRCDSCPTAGPVFFAAFPRSEVNRASGFAYNSSGGVVSNGRDLKVQTQESASDDVAGGIYYLRNDFTIHDAAFNDGYWTVHRRMEQEGKLTHHVKECPDVHSPLKILTWAPAHGWSEATTTLAPAPPLSR